ncbi:Imidazole glycerol phosphate synthase subunit HisF [Gossypium arboreum]|uniref:Imidazole glycerol phosphate synthase subunit HisF n=1 Tax=Gossypium arboreum TaxID=29729 RepID=A0A0B0NUK9_GOSAR|nr:Imidazole glycerol phosphate synthase subunit HisF [Gossypium arboreum]
MTCLRKRLVRGGIGTYGTYLSIALRKINEMLMNHVLRHDRKIIKASLDSGIVRSIVTLLIICWEDPYRVALWPSKWPIFSHTGRDTGMCLSFVARRPFQNEPRKDPYSVALWPSKWPIFAHTGRDTGMCLSLVARRPFRNDPGQIT